jgi:DNA-directed RNA polymerase specialized sigma24 family protein
LPSGDRQDQHADAWHGIVEHLYRSTSPPPRVELLVSGRRALVAEVRDTMRHRGMRRDATNNGARYAAYWEWAGRAVPSPEAAIVERTALYQILSTLTPGQQDALVALASAGDYATAAEFLGVSEGGLKSQLMHGRRRFRALWHEGETPSKHWGVDRRAGAVRGTVGHGSAISRIRRRARDAA